MGWGKRASKLLFLAFFCAPFAIAGSCPKSLSPGLNCDVFSEGCVYVPQTVLIPPLVYIRGLIQIKAKPPKSTMSLFNGKNEHYKLANVANGENRIVFATHRSTTKVSESTISCLQKMNGSRGRLDVASHSAGYKGLGSSASALKGHVRKLFLLDNFYNPGILTQALATIRPLACSGFYTPHRRSDGMAIAKVLASISKRDQDGNFRIKNSNCIVEKARYGHITSVAPFLLRDSNERIVTAPVVPAITPDAPIPATAPDAEVPGSLHQGVRDFINHKGDASPI